MKVGRKPVGLKRIAGILALDQEEVLGPDLIARVIDADDFGHLHDPPAAVAHPLQLHDQVDGRGDLPVDELHRQVGGHLHQHFQPQHDVAGAVGVDGRQRAVVARVHGLQHVQGLGAAAFAHHDAVRPHAQGVADQVADGIGPLAFDVGHFRLESHRRALCSAAARRCLRSVTMRSLSGMKSLRQLSRVVLPVPVPPEIKMLRRSSDGGPEELRRRRGDRLQPHQVLDDQLAGRELADRQARAGIRQRRNDRVDPATVSQAGIDQRAALVDRAAPPGRRSAR